ncbi:MAG: DsbA family protein [Haloarculaceae archaeon]
MSADAHAPPEITLYSDHVCPFCYLGRRSLAAYRAERDGDLAIDWRPFDLRSDRRGPDGEFEDRDVDLESDYFQQVRENVARLREEYDAPEMLGIDEVPEVDSLDAQVASMFVQREHPETWLDFDDALLAALWVDGRDIGNGDVIADVAEAAGLDGEAVRAAVDDEDRRVDIFERFESARREGITGVPTFVYEGTAARGAVPPEHLQRLVDGQ